MTIGKKDVPWKEEIYSAFNALGGAARYEDLYEFIKQTTKRDLTNQWRATVRRTIEDHSSDSENFRATDLFQRLDRGHWGLRSAGDLSGLIDKREGKSPKQVVDDVLHKNREHNDVKLVFVKEHWRKWPEMKESEDYLKLDQALFEVSDAWITDSAIETKLKSGLILQAPISWFPVLSSAKRSDLLEMDVGEFGLFWPKLSFEVLVTHILCKGSSSGEMGAKK